ncbi:hypothetical protein E2P86_08745 [Sphingobacterium psychroaquaticum]|uniref:DUF6965 family protein n=1 Tax=Sphingobacterium psychroaquaticum TaxID=561061 RepID=UPI0010697B72|nr:hypothetical protein [Sphingobacterium psychroaquaticum]QBQ41240.1 hypothetical protein E2P86_08745 [Sphingobacterium psychroaquaticum]
MSISELKSALLGQEYPSEVRINPDQVVTNVDLFLKTSFQMAEAWTKEIDKCPAYIRLVRFHEAVNKG